MSRTIPPNGGPAFPCGADTPGSTDGMSLRDYFAARAMQSLVVELGRRADDSVPEDAPLTIANVAYAIADAMLKARES
jgi:hypothetical protein